MKSEDSFCGACHCAGFGKGDYGPYLFCPGCGHMYLSELDKNVKEIYLGELPEQLLAKRLEIQAYNAMADLLPKQIGIISLVKAK